MILPEREVALSAWLLDEGVRLPDIGALVGGLAERLLEAGVPVARVTSHVRTLHPRLLAVMRVWRRGRGVEEIRPPRADDGPNHTPDYVGSTFQHVRERGEWLDLRLDDPAAPAFANLAGLRAERLTHYVMAPLRFSDGAVNAASWATDAPAGFAAADLATLRALLPALGRVVELRAVRRISTELLGSYVGVEPGERILAGAVRRGDTSRVGEAILFAGLRGFSALAASRTAEATVALLNRYFDAVVPPILAAGGEVLKHVGDGVLAMVREGEAADACDKALAAAREGLRRLAAERLPEGPPLRAGVALHVGEVAYGNIGSEGRLDFTVIGRDVNLASRIADLCGRLDRPLLASSAFAASTSAPFAEVGRFRLKGFWDEEPVLARFRTGSRRARKLSRAARFC
jgi:adenylate cyclase